MNKAIKFIPNLLTLLNLASGCIATVMALWGKFDMAFWMVVIAAVFDFSDGFAARALKAYSPMGKELDSLADMVSFGVAPSMAMFTLLQGKGLEWTWAALAFVLAMFSALRLAKFNIDERQSEEFLGLPTPACALFFVSLGGIFGMTTLLSSPVFLFSAIAVFSLLMVSDIPMFALKFKSFKWQGNELRYCFLIFCLLTFGLLACPIAFTIHWAVVLIIPTYILISIVRALILGGRKTAE